MEFLPACELPKRSDLNRKYSVFPMSTSQIFPRFSQPWAMDAVKAYGRWNKQKKSGQAQGLKGHSWSASDDLDLETKAELVMLVDL